MDKYQLISFLALAEGLQLKGLIKPVMAEEEGNALIEKKPVRSKINNKDTINVEYYEDILEDLDTEVEDMYNENTLNDASVNNHKKDHD